jgi:hypothetical protein
MYYCKIECLSIFDLHFIIHSDLQFQITFALNDAASSLLRQEVLEQQNRSYAFKLSEF